MAKMLRPAWAVCGSLVVLACLQASGQQADDDNDHGLPEGWLTDYEEALEKAAAEEKEILIVFSTSWCGPCQHMVREIYPTDEAMEALEEWVALYIDGDEHEDLVSKYEIQGFPTFVFLDSAGEEIGRKVGGSRDVDNFLAMLENKGPVALVPVGPGGPAATFDVADSDADGDVSADEFAAYVSGLLGPVPFMDQFFQAADVDESGVLSPEEFADRFKALERVVAAIQTG